MKTFIRKTMTITLVVAITLSTSAIPSFAAEEQINQTFEITSIAELENELAIATNNTELVQVYQETDPVVIADYLEDNVAALNEAIAKIDPQDDTQKELDAIATRDETIDKIEYSSTEDPTDDISRSTIEILLENGAEASIEFIDEPESNIILEAFAGTIIYKEYGDRRYTATKSYDIRGIRCYAYNRIGYNLSKTNKSLTFNYTMVEKLNTDNVFSGYVSTATCIKSYVDWFGKKRSYDNYQYLQCNGVYKYVWETTVALLGVPITSSHTEKMTAYVYALEWGTTTVKLSEHCQ